MNRINVTRVLLGGLAAGIVINLAEFVLWGLLIGERYEAMMAAAGLAETSWAMSAYLVGTLVAGIVLAFVYAGIRPRFGPGARTALVAAGVVWILVVALPTIWNAAIGLSMGAGTTLLVLVWTAGEAAVAGLIAGALYQEQESPAMATAGA